MKSTNVPTSKSDMIRKLAKRGKSNSEIRKAVLEVYATCYHSEISRVKASVVA